MDGQEPSPGIECIRVRRVLAQRHYEDRILFPNAIIHSLLQRRLLFSHEKVVADDVDDFYDVDSIKPAEFSATDFAAFKSVVFPTVLSGLRELAHFRS